MIATILADDFTSQNSSGKPVDKAEALSDIKTGKLKISAMTNHDLHVRIMGDVAVVQGTDDETSSYAGKPFKGSYTWTDVYQKRGGKWLAVASQNTKVTKN